MVKAFILYFLNIKSTHGYEIQKYVQINQMDDWTKIQSGSIYYALGKMEKEGLIQVEKEEDINGKKRKVYGITDKGRSELEEILLTELDKPIYSIASDKFVSYPFFSQVHRDGLEKRVIAHISKLESKRKHVSNWQKYKGGEKALKITQLSFEMMISSIDYQIKWHEALLEQMDRCINESEHVSEMIKTTDFAQISNPEELLSKDHMVDIKAIKSSIINNPDDAEEILSELIKNLRKEK